MSTQDDLKGPIVYDIGARWGISPPYDRLVIAPGFRTVGFEPDFLAAEKLRASRAFDDVHPVALGARVEKRILHLAKDPGSSSLFAPNSAEIAKHTEWRLFETIKTVEVFVEPLDYVIKRLGLVPPDYMKIDCEGAEGEILAGATNAVNSLCGMTFEARIRDFYNGGTTLSELITRLSAADFVCLRLDPIGSFHGSLMMFDVVMIRHPNTICTRRQFTLCLLFCLLHGNWLYAKRTYQLRASDFGCADLRQMFEQ